MALIGVREQSTIGLGYGWDLHVGCRWKGNKRIRLQMRAKLQTRIEPTSMPHACLPLHFWRETQLALQLASYPSTACACIAVGRLTLRLHGFRTRAMLRARRIEPCVGQLLKVEGETDEDVARDGKRNSDDHRAGHGRELDVPNISWATRRRGEAGERHGRIRVRKRVYVCIVVRICQLVCQETRNHNAWPDMRRVTDKHGGRSTGAEMGEWSERTRDNKVSGPLNPAIHQRITEAGNLPRASRHTWIAFFGTLSSLPTVETRMRARHTAHATPTFPVYSAAFISPGDLILGGGGGASKTGIKNKLVRHLTLEHVTVPDIRLYVEALSCR
jgi:hypothetical protein